jgi:hypothetical protein
MRVLALITIKKAKPQTAKRPNGGFASKVSKPRLLPQKSS